jgi:hypothetical protein
MGRARNSAIVLALLLSAPVAADDYADFRIPAHRLYGWTANLGSGAGLSAMGDGDQYGSSRFLDGNVSTQGFWLSDSDPGRTSINWSADASTYRSTQRNHGTSIDFTGSRQLILEFGSNAATEDWQASLERRIYPGRSGLALEGAAGAFGTYRQSWQHRDEDQRIIDPAPNQRSLNQDHQAIWRYQNGLFARVAVGLGRVRDATGVLDARVFEERLRRAGVLTRPLSPAGRERLAQLAYVQYGFARVHERAGKYLWREIERLLREDGAVSDSGVDPSAVLRAAERYVGGDGDPGSLIPRSPVPRTVGTFAGLVVTAAHSHAIDRLTSDRFTQFSMNDTVVTESFYSQSSRFTSGTDALYGGGRIEYHRPLGPRWQVDAGEEVLFPLRPHRQGFELSSDLRVQAIVADRWTAGAQIGHTRSIEHARPKDEEPEVDRWRVDLAGNLAFYLEDRIQVLIRADHIQEMVRIPGGFSFIRPGFARRGRVTLGLTYRFLGGLDAPGLITPLRLRDRAW